ncbi:ATP synthase F0 subunit B [uncultured Desulfosarcina sp.]|uniref:ATP synthase F0 subunit B n=1 Tax=uncultured Desulfosarcina sp. TaxID=218289 RepID=UPI0029C8C933|nr:ATP synthase F0 subunit B [uncultured Desulfosarcina sp.]
MRLTDRAGALCVTILFVGFFMVALPAAAQAADAQWRPAYDVAMRWVNFIILVAVIVKYAREPIKDFLRLQKSDIVAEIGQLEKEKARIISEIKAVKQKGIENRAHFNELKDRLIAQGETRKQQIVEQAKQQSKIMMEETRRKMENRIDQAKGVLKMELLNMAIDQAMVKLPSVMNSGDTQHLLDDYMSSLHN